MKIHQYWKSIVATVGAAATTLLGVLPDHSTGWIIATVVVAALTAAGVYRVPNKTPLSADGQASVTTSAQPPVSDPQ